MIARKYRYLLSIASVTAVIMLWAVVSRHVGNPLLFPPPKDALMTMYVMAASGELFIAIRDSLLRVVVGYAAGVGFGVTIGLILGSSRFLDQTVGLLFEFIKGIPPIAIVPVVIMWMGIGEISKYVVVAYIVVIVVAISTAVGAREVPLIRLRIGASMKLNALDRFRWIILPSCLPFVLAGMRSSIGFAFVALVSAELIAANSGIGQIIMDARFALEMSRMIAGLIVLGLLGAVIQLTFDVLVARYMDRLAT